MPDIQTIQIGKHRIGPGHPCFIIAEAGVNHNGDTAMALALIDAAADAGADAVKFQTFSAERLVTRTAPKADYQMTTTDPAESQLAMLKKLELAADAYAALMTRCEARGLVFLSTPFTEVDADLLESLGVLAFKVPSGEVTNLPYLAHLARKGKPIILSTGMCTLGDVELAVATLRENGDPPLAILHCVSRYPAPVDQVNLRAMDTLRAAFPQPIGYSDHTMGTAVAIAARALGATVLEKHLTLDCTLPGPDQQTSVEPQILAAMIRDIRDVEAALGPGGKAPVPCEASCRDVARKSLIAARALRSGTQLTEAMIGIKRPGTGLAPALRPHLVGLTLNRDVPEDTPLTMDMFS